MKNERILFLLLSYVLCFTTARADNPPAKTVFEQYVKQAQDFADNYPREKAYLHFDNTSYYIGDTIWFKAYVTFADKPIPCPISRPLYVELIDQAGHVADKQILRLDQGEGNGQFILSPSMMSGYYEVRAYTRWMLGFTEPQYFSRTFPIYKPSGGDSPERHISTYDLPPSMRLRPEGNIQKLTVSFFPEGGQLVEGVPSKVAFKAESKNEGSVELTGKLYTKEGTELTSLQTMHDGMGLFDYTPSAQPAIAQVVYQGDTYKFELPVALKSGYVLGVSNRGGAMSVRVTCNDATPQDTLALLISYQGRPHFCRLVNCQPNVPQELAFVARTLPAGVLQVTLLDRQGTTLVDRFVYSYPQSPLSISPIGVKKLYTPYEPIDCELQVRNAQGEPVTGNLSVSIRDGIRSDYVTYDNNLFTDLLLTSDLKGYIHQPGYYFTDLSSRKQDELDALMMIHGWRKYDMSQLIKPVSFTPLQLPEKQLMLSGQVKSTLFKKNLKDIAISVMIKEGEQLISGNTTTDAAGNFSIPIDELEGTLDALLQTRKVDKKQNKDAAIYIDRNFSPASRPYAYVESHPQWDVPANWEPAVERFDSLYRDSLRRADDIHLLDEVEIKAKRKDRGNMATRIKEQSIDAYYNVRQSLDLLRDQGKVVLTIPQLMEMLNPLFYWDRSNDSCTYRQKPICYIMDNHILTTTEVNMMLTEVDGLASIIIGKGTKGIDDDILQNSKVSDTNDVDVTALDKYSIFYLIPYHRRDVLNKNQSQAYGTRQTLIQSYTRPLQYYSPAYPSRELYMDKPDKRRTLYWNPKLSIDGNGNATIRCYNNQYTTPLVIQAEMLGGDGKIGSVTYSSLEP